MSDTKLRAAQRDAQWYNYPSVSGAKRWHIIGDDGFAKCSPRIVLQDDNWVPPECVDDRDRCRRPACAKGFLTPNKEIDMTTYYLQNGDEVTADQIKAAFAEGKAVLVHNNQDNHSSTGLMLDGKHMDTRGQCHSVWDEVWTRKAETIQQALNAAYAGPRK